jgi:hypothetical protein
MEKGIKIFLALFFICREKIHFMGVDIYNGSVEWNG